MLITIGKLNEWAARMNAANDWEELWLRSEQARIPKVMTFGKHKGTAIKDVPSDYKRWLLNQPDVDPYLVKALPPTLPQTIAAHWLENGVVAKLKEAA